MLTCPVAWTRSITLAAIAAVALLPRPGLAEPITLSIIDTGGDLASTQAIIENYKKANPQKVKEIKLQRAPAPEVPAKIKAQQDAGRLDINLILTGQDGGSVLAANNQLIKLFPTYDKMFPRDELTEAGKELQDEGGGYLIPSVVSPGGPVLIYNPSMISAAQLPTSVLQLANPKYKNKLAFAAGETDFQPIVTSVARAYGDAAASS